jgi:membrane protease YdiL (CAAX protease family)
MNHPERQKTIWLILIFSLLVTVLAFFAPASGGSPSAPGLGFVLWAIAPILVCLFMRFFTKDWSDFGLKPAISKNMQWYLLSFLAYPLVMVLSLVSAVAISVASMTDFSLGQYLQTALVAWPIFFIFAIFEEFGWRGYLAPKLASLGLNSYLAAALLALVWTAWHIPYLKDLAWVYSSEELMSFIPRYYLVLCAFSILFGEIRSITGSVWPAVILHASMNAFGHPFAAGYVRVAAGMDYLGSVSTGLFVICFSLLLGMAVNRWRLSKGGFEKSLT